MREFRGLRFFFLICLVFFWTGCSDSTDGTTGLATVDAGSPEPDTSPPSSCPAEPSSPDGDPCMVCACDDAGVLTCTPRAAGEGCADADCCTTASACVACPEGEACPESGMRCEAELTQTCDDGTICTQDAAVCEEGQCKCVHTPAPNGTQCLDDPHTCTTGDTCMQGMCVAGAPAELDDGNPCTAGICVKGIVQQKALEGPCNDGDSCTTGDTCVLGQCVPDALVECPVYACASASYCDPDVGECVVQFKADGASCISDGLCVTSATCQEGVCIPVETKSCEDGDPCTDDQCDNATGSCYSIVKPDLTPCGPAGSCIGSQLCLAGVCTPPEPTICDDDDPCTVDACDPDTGKCVSSPAEENTICTIDDDACVKSATCKAGVCEPFTIKTCDDGDVCTLDSCVAATGCVWTPIDGCGAVDKPCSQASARFTGESCLKVLGPVTLPGDTLTIEFWIRVDSYEGDSYASVLDNFEGPMLLEPGVRISLPTQGAWGKSMHYQETYPAFNQDGEPAGKAHGVLTIEKFDEGVWHHFAAVHDVGGKVRVFMNGKSQNSIGWDTFYDTMTNGDDLYIGCRDGTQWFLKGHIDEMRISSVARYTVGGYNPIETVFTPDADTIALYRFESVSMTDQNLPIAWDHSGNEYHAYWLGETLLGEPAPLVACEE